MQSLDSLVPFPSLTTENKFCMLLLTTSTSLFYPFLDKKTVRRQFHNHLPLKHPCLPLLPSTTDIQSGNSEVRNNVTKLYQLSAQFPLLQNRMIAIANNK